MSEQCHKEYQRRMQGSECRHLLFLRTSVKPQAARGMLSLLQYLHDDERGEPNTIRVAESIIQRDVAHVTSKKIKDAREAGNKGHNN